MKKLLSERIRWSDPLTVTAVTATGILVAWSAIRLILSLTGALPGFGKTAADAIECVALAALFVLFAAISKRSRDTPRVLAALAGAAFWAVYAIIIVASLARQ
ncbi:hypothetical protein [Leifsonia sp. 2MCAF36]|uniref:hypothetical protein n=1 Tax=Leifsonia sp. 2MCAF36 TaxID=3232988 RepID=UPI003F9BD45D